MQLVEIVLHDPARERVVVIDPVRHRKTEIATVQLERLGASLAKWAQASDDRLVRWAGGPDFNDDLREEEGRLELAGPRARYAVTHVAAAAPAYLTASGYGDLAAKIPGGADWILADVTGVEPIDADVWR